MLKCVNAYLLTQVDLKANTTQASHAGVAAGSRYLILKASALPAQPSFIYQASAVMPGADGVPSIVKFEVPLARPPKCTSASCLELYIQSDEFPTAIITASAMNFSSNSAVTDGYQGLEYEFGTVVGPRSLPVYKPLTTYGPSSQYVYKSLPQGNTTVYVCVALAGSRPSATAGASALNVCETKVVIIRAPSVGFDAATAVASFNVTLLELSGDLSQLADAARLLSNLAAYVNNSATDGTAQQSLQSAVQGPAADLVMSASRMVNRDSPVAMHQVRC